MKPKPKPEKPKQDKGKPASEDINQRAHRTLQETIEASERPWPFPETGTAKE